MGKWIDLYLPSLRKDGTMDMDMFEKDATEAMKVIPREFVQDVMNVLQKHDLSAIVPKVMGTMGPHVRALVFGLMMPGGGVDKAELETVIKRVLSNGTDAR